MMANPFGTNHDHQTQPTHCVGGSSSPAPESVEWTAEEQSILEKGLNECAPVISKSESNIIWYAKIAAKLPQKTVRDVALRCRWTTRKEANRRRREGHSLMRRSKDGKEKISEPSASYHVAAWPVLPPSAQRMDAVDNDDDISYRAIGGPLGQLLEQNSQCLDQISANFTTHKIYDNMDLFYQARNNILRILSNLCDGTDLMKRMPPLPVQLNEELANSILPRMSLPKQP